MLLNPPVPREGKVYGHQPLLPVLPLQSGTSEHQEHTTANSGWFLSPFDDRSFSEAWSRLLWLKALVSALYLLSADEPDLSIVWQIAQWQFHFHQDLQDLERSTKIISKSRVKI